MLVSGVNLFCNFNDIAVFKTELSILSIERANLENRNLFLNLFKFDVLKVVIAVLAEDTKASPVRTVCFES